MSNPALQLLVRIQYPQEIGCVNTTSLNNVLKQMRGSQYTDGYDCCLGARIAVSQPSDPKCLAARLADPIRSSSSSVDPAPHGASSAGLDVTVTDQQYYCKTAKWRSNDASLIPTILAEVYVNGHDMIDHQVKLVYEAIKAHLVPKDSHVNICVMSFFLGEEDAQSSSSCGSSCPHLCFKCSNCST